MAGICTSTTSPNNCTHRVLTVTLDGTPVTIRTTDVADPLTAEELEQLVSLGVRRLRASGVTMANFLNRVIHGDEANNVKQYDLVAVGSAIALTNIGTAYVNILPGANGQRSLVDFTGCVEFRLIMSANLIGTGAWAARVVRDSDSNVLFESLNLGAAGERELDSGWQALPAWAVSQGETLLRAQMKSATAADDPVVRRVLVLTR